MNGKIMKLKTMFSTLATVVLLTTGTPAMAAKPGPAPEPSGTMSAILDFNAEWTSEVPTISSVPVVPFACQTAEYTAGQNEIAVVSMEGFLASGSTQLAFLVLRVATSNDGISFHPESNDIESLSEISGSIANVSVSRTIPLDPGVQYSFGAQFSAYPNSVPNSWARCSGTVTIFRL